VIIDGSCKGERAGRRGGEKGMFVGSSGGKKDSRNFICHDEMSIVKLGMVVHSCNPSTQEVEAGGSIHRVF
jgi:hypothetical protein